MARINKTQYAVLGMLELGLGTGYEMKSFVESSLGHFWAESYGALYPILKRLSEQSLIREDTGADESPRARRVYASTDGGRAALRDWLSAPVGGEPSRNELLLKLFFGARISRDDCLAHIERAERAAEQTRATYEGIEAQIEAENPDHPEAPFWKITLSFGRHMGDALLAWADEARGVLEAQPARGAMEAATAGAGDEGG